ncbi:MAG: hypothetical protein C0606_06550 [Hyphomicrobiales bacterium]|nr:MAG: hypothetical protein C0606_06550 [Hyphomicrobiales bacterium]
MGHRLDIVHQGDTVLLSSASTVLLTAPADDVDGLFEYAMDFCDEDQGHIRLSSGRYVLKRPIRVDKSVTFEGAGYATKLIPPAGEFAVDVRVTARSPLRRDIIRDATTWLYNMENRTHGIVMHNLCIDGEGRGKGLSVEFLMEGVFSNLFIHRTRDGAGLRLGPSVMETTFRDVHLLDCGTRREAAVSLESQPGGDACNNVTFQSVYIIFPNGTGLEVGAGKGAEKPRLITLRDCMIHGWLPWQKTAKGPLLKISALDPVRGLRMFGGRVTCAHVEFPYVRLIEGAAKFHAVSFGGGGANTAISTQPGTHIVVRDCDFHGSRAANRRGDIAHIAGDFEFDANTCEPDCGRLVFNESARGFVSHNRFLKTAEGRPLILRHGDAAKNVAVEGNLFSCKRDQDDANAAQSDTSSSGE